MRNKGKVHPFTSPNLPSKSSSSSSPNKDSHHLSVLKLLPVAIFTLVSVLSLDEREVLAFMITRSLKSTNLSLCPAVDDVDTKKTPKNKQPLIDSRRHISPSVGLFDCDCFDCYTAFWFRWDSSPNRELIHQAIEAFEDHLNTNGNNNHFGNGKNKRKEKSGRRKIDRKTTTAAVPGGALGVSSAKNQERLLLSVENEVARAGADCVEMEVDAASPPTSAVVHNHKGFARKMLPDVMGIFNSRLWSLWSPNV